MNYFKDVKNNDIESCVWVLADDEKRAAFERDFKQFLKSMDIIMPPKEAAPYLDDLKFLIDFFRKEDEINALRRDLKHILTDHDIDDKTLRNKIIDRFVEQAEVKFKTKVSLYA